MNQFQKNIALVLTVALVFLIVWSLFNQPKAGTKDINYSELIAFLDKGEISEVTIQGDGITGKLANGNAFKTYAPKDDKLVTQFREKGVKITAKPTEDSWYMTLLVSWLPMILLVGVWIFFMRQMQAGGGKAMAFGKSKARLITDKSKKVTFADVAGIDEAKAELEEVIDFLKDPKKYTRLGGRIPKGLLLIGPPGTGKTLLARAIAGEAEVPFLTISGSDFVEMFVGVGASRVRDLFSQAKKNAPCIIFIDEIDAVGRHRGAGLGGGHDEREQTLNQLLDQFVELAFHLHLFEPLVHFLVESLAMEQRLLDSALELVERLLAFGQFVPAVVLEPALEKVVRERAEQVFHAHLAGGVGDVFGVADAFHEIRSQMSGVRKTGRPTSSQSPSTRSASSLRTENRELAN